MPYSPVGIGYLASILRENGHEVHFIDCAILDQPYSETVRQVENLNPDAIGITAVTAYYSEMKKLSRMLHKLKIPIILGGVHVTRLPELSLRECGADFAVLGEGELTLLELMNNWDDKEKRKTINGIAYIENDKLVMNPQRELIEDLDSLPFPAWDLIHPKNYPAKYYLFKAKRYPVAMIFTTRGCPHTCAFCASTNFWRNEFRKRSPKNVVDEIEYLMNEFGVREIQITDDYFNCDKNHVIEVCREVIRRKLDVTFQCPNGLRMETLDEEMLTIMRKAGFYALVFAIESGSQSILNDINKRLNLRKVHKVIKLANKLGYFLMGYFIYNLPGETYETARRTIQIAKSLPFNVITSFIAKPLPGSRWFDQWIQNKDVSKVDYDWFHFIEIESKLEFSDGKRTLRIPKDAIREFYFRPIQILRYLKYWVHTFNFNQSVLAVGRRLITQVFNRFNREQSS